MTLAEGEHETTGVRLPFTNEVFAELPLCGQADVELAVARGRQAQRAWSDVAVGERCRILLGFHDLVLERWQEALDLIQLETGKARGSAVEELVDVVSVCRYYAAVAAGLLRSRRRGGAVPGLTRTREHRHPRGVVGVIAPWNYPLALSISDSVPALAAGNAVIVKPDLQTSHCALWSLSLLREAGLPAGVCQVVTGDGPGAGGAVVDRVDYLSFTGSTATGRVVAERAGSRLIGCSLELGGKNPMIVRADADPGRAVAGAVRGCFANAGQLCISFERLYVHAGLYDRFLEAFVDGARSLRLGAGFDFRAEMGSLISAAQLRKVQYHVDEAVVEGAQVRTGGRARPDLGPFFFEPTVLTGVRETMRIAREETFGPVVAVYPFHSDDEAVRLANDSPYGLNASIWSRDTAEAERLGRRIETGSVNINEAYTAAWASMDAPMGGYKESGIGRRHGAEGLLKYTEAQAVAVQKAVALDLATSRLGGSRGQRWLRRILRVLPRVPGLR